MSVFEKKHSYPGKLFIVEGVDGSGKSTQVSLLRKWLEAEGYSVFYTEWNSSELVKETTKEAKKYLRTTASVRRSIAWKKVER